MTDIATQPIPADSSWNERLKLRLSTIVWFLLAVGFLLALPVILDISWLLVLALAVLALILALPATWLVRALFKRQRQQLRRTSFAKAFAALLFVLSIIAAAPVYFFALYTDLHPMTVPQATLSNGSKTVVFQGMAHIGSEGFYKSVVYDLESALNDGYVLYYEGVMGSKDGDEWFNQHLAGGGDLNTNYQMLSEVCGLNFQLDYFGLLTADRTLHPERHISADVTTADMMHEYDRLMQSDPVFAASQTPATTQATTEPTTSVGGGATTMIGWLQQGSPQLRALAGTVCRGFISLELGKKAAPEEMDKVIVDFRNRKLADRILSDTNQKIYITYGAGHLPGLLALLEASDASWTMKSLKWLRPVVAPEDLDGKL